MKINKIVSLVENYGLVIISIGVTMIYWRIEILQLGISITVWITSLLFIGYGVFIQYFINSHKRMVTEVHSLSITDPLTGLYNRRGFTAFAEKMIRISERAKKGSLLMLLFADLDKMKSINDSLGHTKGDTALIEVSTILKEVFRESDIIARIGGDEFAVIGMMDQKSSIRVFESRLQEQIDIHNDHENRDYTISLSIGIACRDQENRYSIDELMSMADKLMYEHKRNKLL